MLGRRKRQEPEDSERAAEVSRSLRAKALELEFAQQNGHQRTVAALISGGAA